MNQAPNQEALSDEDYLAIIKIVEKNLYLLNGYIKLHKDKTILELKDFFNKTKPDE